MQVKTYARGLVMAFLALACGSFAIATHGATITVRSTADTIAPNDGSVTLREAMAAINAGNNLGDPDIIAQNPGTFGTNDTILFSIPGLGVKTLVLTSGLPIQATKPVTIDGYSQPGATPNSLAVGDNAAILIRIDQNGAGSAFDFQAGATGSSLRGVAIVNTGSNVVHIGADNVTIIGNFVGLDTDGATQTGNGSPVAIDSTVQNAHIGSGTPADRNVLDSSGSEMQLFGTFTVVAGNYINTNAAGTAGLGGSTHGLSIGGGVVLVGGFTPAEGNVIGKWNGNGINVGLQNINIPLTTIQIEGNFIGVNAQGTAVLSPGLNGIALGNGTYTTQIGHSLRNVISGAAQFGIVTTGDNGNVTIENNRIGTDITGSVSIPNGQTGVCFASPVTGNVGNGLASGNIIANNGTQGIAFQAPATVTISGNSIFNNGGLGISFAGRCDIAGVSPTPNDVLDNDTGPNGKQNFPVITSANISAGQVTISGNINTNPNADVGIEFFANAVCDASGNGEGQTYIGFTGVTTDGSGNASFGPVTFPVPAGQPVITATASGSTSAATSEFSACINAGGTALPALSINNVSANEGNSGTTPFTFTVTLSAASSSTVTVNFATADGTATAPSDYAATSGTLSFAPGVTSQTITVNVVGDTTVEPNETFTVTLSGPNNATIATGTGTGTILNDDAAALPTLSINNVSANEGNSGTTPFTFTVTLSAASSATVTVNFATADGSAVAPGDYTATSGVLTFAPGVTTQTITVNVNGDVTVEPNETFVVNLSAPSNATIAVGQGTGTIVNDDAAIVNPATIIPTLDVRALGALIALLALAAAATLRRRR